MLTQTGVSLRSLHTCDLFDAAYVLMVQSHLRTEEEHDVVDAINKRLSDAAFEADTGMPAITKWMAPANEADLPQHIRNELPEGLETGLHHHA